jgi:hypothetical protein
VRAPLEVLPLSGNELLREHGVGDLGEVGTGSGSAPSREKLCAVVVLLPQPLSDLVGELGVDDALDGARRLGERVLVREGRVEQHLLLVALCVAEHLAADVLDLVDAQAHGPAELEAADVHGVPQLLLCHGLGAREELGKEVASHGAVVDLGSHLALEHLLRDRAPERVSHGREVCVLAGGSVPRVDSVELVDGRDHTSGAAVSDTPLARKRPKGDRLREICAQAEKSERVAGRHEVQEVALIRPPGGPVHRQPRGVREDVGESGVSEELMIDLSAGNHGPLSRESVRRGL